MFFITVLDVDDNIHEEQKRGERLYIKIKCWGFFQDEEKAVQAVKENWTDMYEDGYYNMAVVEEIGEGLPAFPEKQRWFIVNPIINEEAIKRREERKKAWEEAVFFGKRLGEFMHRVVIRHGGTVGEAEVSQLVGSLHEICARIPDMEWSYLYKVQAGNIAPIFTSEQWSVLASILELSQEESEELTALQVQAMADSEHHGKPVSLRGGNIIAWASGPTEGSAQRGGDWQVSGYDITEIECPKRFVNSGPWALG